MLSIALEMVPPVLRDHGTEEQRQRLLPPIARGESAWCQLLSEPDAGSDLTAISTFAAADGEGWTVSGQKVWTSGATAADHALLLARTDRDAPGRAGVSCFALRMDQPGVEVRPLRQFSGAYHFNEVFLDGARLDAGDLIGGLGDGFAALRTMLASERAAIGGGTSARSFTALRVLAAATGAAATATGRQEVARSFVRERVLDLLVARSRAVPGGGSLTKLAYSGARPALGERRPGHARSRRHPGRGRRGRPVDRPLPLRSRAPDRRRHRRDPTHDHRRAGPGPPERTPTRNS